MAASGLLNRALIFLDVDGPLITFSARPIGRQAASGVVAADLADTYGNPLLDRLDPEDGRRLLALGVELVWATTWSADANEVISPRLGLPQLPVVAWPDCDDEPRHGLHWKTVVLTRWATGRSFIWIDDEITDADRAWVAIHHAEPALLHRVDPHVGLTEADFFLIRQWLAG